MKHFLYTIGIVNILGLTTLQLLEVWRAGSAAGLVSIGGMFLFALATTTLALLVEVLDRRSNPSMKK